MEEKIKLEEIKTYSGYRGEQRPVSFKLGDEIIKVSQIVSIKRVAHISSTKDYNEVFSVLGENGKTYTLIRCNDGSGWFLLGKNV